MSKNSIKIIICGIMIFAFSANFSVFANEERDLDESITISPSPTKNIVVVEAEENITILNIAICNVSGKRILDTKEKEIDLSSYEDGTYFIQIKTTDGYITKKIVKNS